MALLFSQILETPVITGLGLLFILTANELLVVAHPVAFTESVTLTEPTPAAAQFILTELLP